MSSVAELLPPELRNLPITEEMIDAALLPRSLYDYVGYAWKIAQPSVPFVDGWHIGAICEHLQAVSEGQIRYLVISIAPRHMKSWNTSVFWPTWDWTRTPARQWVFASYGLDLAIRDAVYSRRLIDSPWYQTRWGCKCGETPHAKWCTAFRFTGDQNVKSLYENDRTGRRLTASVEAGTTGHGGDILVMDDPLDLQKAESPVTRLAAQHYFDQVWTGRMNDPRRSSMVVIAQRSNEDDITGHALKQGGWEHLCLPSEYNRKATITTSIGWKDPRKEDGELLWPGRFGPDEIARAKVILGSYGYSAQHAQNPSPASGGTIQRSWWKFYDAETPPAEWDQEWQSWDCSYKDLATSDPVVGQLWGRVAAMCYLRDSVRGRMNFPETLSAIRNASQRWHGAIRKLIEAKAAGQPVIDTLRRELPGIIPVEVPALSKQQRVAGVSPMIEAGNVLLPGRRIPDDSPQGYHYVPAFPWVADFIEECAAFPVGSNDDQVDAMSQSLAYVQPAAWGSVGRAWAEAKEGQPVKTLKEAHTRETHAWIREQIRLRSNGHNGNGHASTRLPGLG